MRQRSVIASALSFLFGRLKGRRMAGVATAVLLMVVAGYLATVPATLLGRLVDTVAVAQDARIDDSIYIIGFVFFAIVMRELIVWFRKFIVETIATSLEKNEIVGVIRSLLRAKLTAMAEDRIGSLNLRIHRSIDGLVKLFKVSFLDFFPSLATALIALLVAGKKSIPVAMVMLLVALCGALLTRWQIVSQAGIRLDLFRSKEDMAGNVSELLMGLDYVRATGGAQSELTRADELAEQLRRKELGHHKAMMSFDASKQLVEGVGLVAVIAFGAYLATIGSISKGDVLVFAMLFSSVSAPLRELHRVADEGYESALKVRDLISLYGRPRDVGLDGTILPIPPQIGMDIISLTDLTVSVPGGAAVVEPSLSRITLRIPHGQRVGVVGPSGAGKSTLLKVILGLVPDYTGSAEIFGVEVRDIDKVAYINRVAYVPQSPFILKGSVRDNVLYGSSEIYSDDDIMQSLRMAQLESVVSERSGNLDAVVGEQGKNFSGGERQRLVLARVFLQGRDLVLFDEPTAALDAVSESMVQKAIEQVVSGRTAIIVAHRLRTLVGMDRIVVMDRGVIVQDGSFETLRDTPGKFRELVMGGELK